MYGLCGVEKVLSCIYHFNLAEAAVLFSLVSFLAGLLCGDANSWKHTVAS